MKLIERAEQEGIISPDVMIAEFDKWWDIQKRQKFGNRREFKPAAAAAQTDPAKRQEAIDYVKGVLQQEDYAKLKEKSRLDAGVKMLAEVGIEVTADELKTQTGRVKMKAPDGKIYEVDRSELKEAEKHGWVTF